MDLDRKGRQALADVVPDRARRVAHRICDDCEERANWDPDVLREKDQEIRAYDEACRAQMVPHCRAFAARVDRDVARLTGSFMSTPT
jgi:hypothetical protein